MQNRLSGFFGGTFPPFGNGDGGPKRAEWSPHVDISEDDKEYLVKADLPEMKKEEIKINVENGVLSITGERNSEKEEKNKKVRRIERSFGSFERTFTVRDDADAGKIAAKFQDGVLKLHVPKNPRAEAEGDRD